MTQLIESLAPNKPMQRTIFGPPLIGIALGGTCLCSCGGHAFEGRMRTVAVTHKTIAAAALC